MTASGSPWRAALGPRHGELDPSLRTYFDDIPQGSVGRGSGVFRTVGTPRRWIWPVLALLGRAGIVFPVWDRDVPFEIVNRPTARGQAASRVFLFRDGTRTMVDEVRWARGRLLQGLGSPVRLVVELVPRVEAGRLEVTSRAVFVRIAGRLLRIPFAPRVHLVESPAGQRQHVELTLELPLLGRVYEYAGDFVYAVEPA